MSGKSGIEKLREIRKRMECAKANESVGIQAYILPCDDAHQSEWLADHDKRIPYMSGFTGSAGTIVITQDEALLWTDARYFNQAQKQFDPPNAWEAMELGVPGTPSVEKWLVENLPANSKVGCDPTLMTDSRWALIEKKLKRAYIKFVSPERNLVDEVWAAERPAAKLNPIITQKIEYSGQKSGDKVAKCLKEMEKNKVQILVITALDEVAYLLNWRGSDILYNPVFFAYVVIAQGKVHIFVDQQRIEEAAKIQLQSEGVEAAYHPYEEFREFLRTEAKSRRSENAWVWHGSSRAVFDDVKPLNTVTGVTPICLMKMIKNEREIEGMKKAHVKDAVGIVKYFAWLEDKIKGDEQVTEISGAQQLEKFRQELENYVGPSFATITAFGPNAAMISYRPKPHTDLPITTNNFYMCDAGSQFPDGTTDVTRTLHFGQPSDFERECYTRVFKGQCNFARAQFPVLTIGNQLDTLARHSLWSVGLDYGHGTGHGVGAYLNVHEGPMGVTSKRRYVDDPGLQAGMFISNEPGYYEKGKFGIRLENVELVVKASKKYTNLTKEFLTFETVTVVPIQTKSLLINLLTNEEVEYLNEYNARCLSTLKPHLQGPKNAQALAWLEKETKPITKLN